MRIQAFLTAAAINLKRLAASILSILHLIISVTREEGSRSRQPALQSRIAGHEQPGTTGTPIPA